MSNKSETFYKKNNALIAQLVNCLDVINAKFDYKEAITTEEASDAAYMLDAYVEALQAFKAENVFTYRRLTTNSTEKFNESMVKKELTDINRSIPILLRLGREKIIAVGDDSVNHEVIRALQDKQYCDHIVIEPSGGEYYSLSGKANKALTNENIMKFINEGSSVAVIPNRIMKDPSLWDGLYVKRLELINKYYKSCRNNAEYVVFSLNDDSELIFGCELNDSLSVVYAIAGVYYEEHEKFVGQLNNLSRAGVIDELIIIAESDEDEETLQEAGIGYEDSRVSFVTVGAL